MSEDLRAIPDDMTVDLNKGLTIRWADGVEHFFPVRALRLKSPCAQWREYTKDRTPEQLEVIYGTVPKDVVFTDAHEVGHYALGFAFSDGHRTGIFDFEYLREIGDDITAAAQAAADFNARGGEV